MELFPTVFESICEKHASIYENAHEHTNTLTQPQTHNTQTHRNTLTQSHRHTDTHTNTILENQLFEVLRRGRW